MSGISKTDPPSKINPSDSAFMKKSEQALTTALWTLIWAFLDGKRNVKSVYSFF